MSSGISLIIFRSISENKNERGTNPEETSYHDSLSNEKIFMKYIDYDINHNSKTFKNLFVTRTCMMTTKKTVVFLI